MPDSGTNKASTNTKTIYIVDDEETVRDFFHAFLSKDGFKVVDFKSGTETLEHLKSKSSKVDLVILDLMMPGRGGYDVLKELQESQYKGVPIFIVTARHLDEQATSIFLSEPNVKGFWTKPVVAKTFRDKVHEILGTEPRKTFDDWQG